MDAYASRACTQGAAPVLQTALDLVTSSAWVHLASPLAGGLVAGLLFRITHPSQLGSGATCLRGTREVRAARAPC